MRSIHLVIPTVAGALLLSSLACNPSNANSSTPGTPETAVADSDAPNADPVADPAAAPPAADSETPPDSEAASDEPSGEMDLPPGSASAWNTGQSDGQPGKADRGIKDYQRIISDNRDRFRSCYDAALAKHEGIKGQVTLEWVLDPKGKVKEGAHIDPDASDIQDEFLEKCMVAALRNLSFPPSRRGMESTVRYPFRFNPGSNR